MSAAVVLALLVSAILHTLWNTVLKQAVNGLATSTGILTIASLIATGPMLHGVAHHGLPPIQGVIPALATSLMWLAYYELLLRSFQSGDLSVAYPITRGVAPVAGVAIGLLTGERPSALGLAGIALIVASVWLISRPLDPTAKVRHPWEAVLVGALSAVYSAVDKYGVRVCEPLTYYWMCLAFAAVWLGLRTRQVNGPGAVAALFRQHRWRMVVAGACDFGSYGLVLYALTTTPMMYVVPLRATAVLLSVLVGALFLGEPALRRRLAYGGLMVAGIALLAIWG